MQFVSPLQKCFDHLLLPSSRLWNACIQSRGCDWWGREAAMVLSPQPKKEPPVADKPVSSLGSHTNK